MVDRREAVAVERMQERRWETRWKCKWGCGKRRLESPGKELPSSPEKIRRRIVG